MANLLSGIPKIVEGATKSIRYALVLTKTTTTVTASKPWEPATQVDAAHACEGLVTEYDAYHVNGTTILANDRKALIIAATLPTGIEPADGDKLTAQGKHYNVIHVKRDPASATFECQLRMV